MQNLSRLLIVFALVLISYAKEAEAAVVVIGGPSVALVPRQPVQAVIVDGSGNTYNQTYYYDPSIGGVDIDPSWAGPNASVYFPAYGNRYLAYGGNWVGEDGFYWSGRNRIYVGHPEWRSHWGTYWGSHPHWHESWHSHPEVSVHMHESWHEHGHYHYHH